MIANELAYIAGLIDGEGTITIKKRLPSQQTAKAVNTSYSGEIQVEMTHEPTIRRLKEIFGKGNIRTRDRGHKPLWTWKVSDAAAREVAWELLPYLRIKQRQAELVIALPVWPRGRGAVPEELVTLKEHMKQEINALNKVGV